MKKVVRIYDSAFAHSNYFTAVLSSEHIQWIREGSYNTCFFTDRELCKAAQVSCRKKIAWLLEPPVIYPDSYDFVRKNTHLFDYILTYETGLLNLSPKCLFYPPCAPWIRKEDQSVHRKSKLVSMILSDKSMTEGHRFRFVIANRLGSRIDLFGVRHRPLPPISGKIEALRDYRFSVVVLNCRIANFFTEQLLDCFLTGTVPIMWGTPNIGNYFDEGGILQFGSLVELDEILHSLSDDLYERLKHHILVNFDKASQYGSIEDWIYTHYGFLFGD